MKTQGAIFPIEILLWSEEILKRKQLLAPFAHKIKFGIDWNYMQPLLSPLIEVLKLMKSTATDRSTVTDSSNTSTLT